MRKAIEIWHRLTFPKVLVSVEYCFSPEGKQLNATVLKKDKKEIKVLKAFAARTIDELASQLGKDIPVVLNITGKRVLSRKRSTSIEETLDEQAKRAFPNMNLEELYFQEEDQGMHGVVSAVRLDTAEALLTEFRQAQLSVIALYISVFGVLPLLKALGVNQAHLGYHQVKAEEGEVELVQTYNTEELALGNERLEADKVPAFLGGLKFFMQLPEYEGAGPGDVHTRFEEWRFVHAYKKLLPAMAIGLLVLLLSSFMVFNHYYTKNQALLSGMAGARASIKTLEGLKQSVLAKEDFLLHNAGSKENLTLMCDQLAASVPGAVSLDALTLFPLVKRHKREHLFEFAQTSLEIKGKCSRYSELQGWLVSINQLPFVKEIMILGYGDSEKQEPEKFHLLLKLDI